MRRVWFATPYISTLREGGVRGTWLEKRTRPSLRANARSMLRLTVGPFDKVVRRMAPDPQESGGGFAKKI
jgi:hypothetical protein